jgi:hypothetical protein
LTRVQSDARKPSSRLVAGGGLVAGNMIAWAVTALAATFGILLVLAVLKAQDLAVHYPGALLTAARLPSVQVAWRAECLQIGAISKSLYSSRESQPRLLLWLRNHGWMVNYRYTDSVLQQYSSQAGPLGLTSVQEIFVRSQAGGSKFVATALMSLSIGSC